MTITKANKELSMPIERFILQATIKFHMLALKALLWYQSWSEDLGSAYCHKAMEMYNILEGAIVNG
jgi:hypothetical protein